MNPEYEAWLATKPPQVQRLAREFPANMVFLVGDKTLYLIGYQEGKSDTLIVSEVDPCVNWERANAEKQYLCAEHARQGESV